MKRMKLGMLLLCTLLTAVGCAKKEPKVVIGTGGGFEAVSSGNAEKEAKNKPLLFIYRGVMEDTDLMLFQKVTGSAQELAYHYTGGTDVFDRYGQPKAVEQLTPGEIYELTIDVNTQTVETMRQSDKVWVFPNLIRFALDKEHDRMVVGEESYHLNDLVPVFDGADVFTRDQIGENDELTLIGQGKEIISVIISTEHGELQFKNIAGFEKGYFVLGNVAAARITKEETLPVRAGTYLLSVAGSGRGGSEEITIEPGKVTTVDLAKYHAGAKKDCMLTLLTEQKNVTVTINGKEVAVGKAMKLPYGVYRINASKKGYDDWTKLLFVNSKKAVISINLSDKTGSTNANANNSKPTSGLAGSVAGSIAGKTTTESNGSKSTQTTTENSNSNTTSTTSNTSGSNTGSVGGLANEVMKILTDSGKQTSTDTKDNKSEDTKENN
ncbi:hypothetical protein SAMN02910358_02036 [Lachnospiraceae bacterium XBB1006]|nr:hypothetical protein SAMN02910358_02036 [Lachnospiraceae bacterium XBB1006]